MNSTKLHITGGTGGAAQEAVEGVYRTLRMQRGVEVSGMSRPLEEGEKAGELLNELAISLIASGSLTAIVEAVRSVVKKDSTLQVELSKDGRSLKVNATNIDDDDVNARLKQVFDATAWESTDS